MTNLSGLQMGQVPIGTIVATLISLNNFTDGSTGWLPCDGSAIDATRFSNFISLTGLKNTPDLGGRTLIGANSTYQLQSTGGEETHTLTIDEMPKHQHPTGQAYGYDIYTQNGDDIHLICVDPNGATAPMGNDQSHNNMQPYYVVNYIIYAGPPSSSK